MRTNTGTLTDFLREPKKVLRMVDKQDIVLRRRNKPSLRLSLESRNEGSSAGTEIAAHVLADAMAAVPEIPSHLPDILTRRYPWMRFLPVDARGEFAREFIETVQSCAAIGNSARLDEMLHAWKATAEIHADPTLHAQLTRPLPASAGARVPRPVAKQ